MSTQHIEDAAAAAADAESSDLLAAPEYIPLPPDDSAQGIDDLLEAVVAHGYSPLATGDDAPAPLPFLVDLDPLPPPALPPPVVHPSAMSIAAILNDTVPSTRAPSPGFTPINRTADIVQRPGSLPLLYDPNDTAETNMDTASPYTNTVAGPGYFDMSGGHFLNPSILNDRPPHRIRQRLRYTRSPLPITPPLTPSAPIYCLTPIFLPTHPGQKILTYSPPARHLSSPGTEGWVTHAVASSGLDLLSAFYHSTITPAGASTSNDTNRAVAAVKKYHSFLALMLTYHPFVELFSTYQDLKKLARCERSMSQRAWMHLYPTYKRRAVEQFREMVAWLYGVDVAFDFVDKDLRVREVWWPFKIEVNGCGGGRRGRESVIPVGLMGEEIRGVSLGAGEVGIDFMGRRTGRSECDEVLVGLFGG